MNDPDMLVVMGLKDPWKFLFVDADIAMLACCVGFVVLSMGMPTPVVVAAGGGVGFVMHTARKGKPKGYTQHFMYWHLPPALSRLKCVPPNWAARTIG